MFPKGRFMQLSSFSLLLEENFGKDVQHDFDIHIPLKFWGVRVKEASAGQDHVLLFLGLQICVYNWIFDSNKVSKTNENCYTFSLS